TVERVRAIKQNHHVHLVGNGLEHPHGKRVEFKTRVGRTLESFKMPGRHVVDHDHERQQRNGGHAYVESDSPSPAGGESWTGGRFVRHATSSGGFRRFSELDTKRQT